MATAKKNPTLTPEELAAKRSAAAKKAAATRKANKAKREAEAAAKAAERRPVGDAIAEALVAEDAGAPTVAGSAGGDDAPLEHAAFAEDGDAAAGDEDYDEAVDAEYDEALAFVQEALGADAAAPKKKKKKDKKPKADKAEDKDGDKVDAKTSDKAAKKKKKKDKKAKRNDAAEPTYALAEGDGDAPAGAPAKPNIDHLQVDKTRDAEDDGDGARPTFSGLGLVDPLRRAVADMGFEHPTVIQARAIPVLLEGPTDLVGLAQTGTGKTAAFGLPALQALHVHTRVPQVLVLAPTRELCLQITVELGNFAKYMREVDVAPVYGGADIVKQIKQIRRGVQVVVATPGRLRDLIRRRAIDLQHVNTLVLDEADEMLNMGFKEELDDILESIPDEAHTWLFSATMPAEVRRIASEYMTDPAEVQSGERNAANADIAHRYVVTRPRERFGVLRRFLDYDPDMYGLVFVRTRRDAKELAEALAGEGYDVDALHGDLSQAQRDNVMGRFRARRLQVLVATDVAARGIDVTGITHVFHLNLPDDLSFYTHRAGRTGRAGAEGVSLALVHPKDTRKLRQIERIIKARFEEVAIPGGEAIIARRLMSNMRRLKAIEVADGLDAYLPQIEEALAGLTREDVIKRVASRSFEKLFADYRFAPDLNDRRGRDVVKRSDRERERDAGDRAPRRERGGDENMERLFINVGAMDVGGRKGNFLAMLCDAAGISSRDVGRITLNKTHSFFDVDRAVARQTVERLSELHFDGRPVRINPADRGESRGGGGGRDRDRGDRRGGKRDKRGRW